MTQNQQTAAATVWHADNFPPSPQYMVFEDVTDDSNDGDIMQRLHQYGAQDLAEAIGYYLNDPSTDGILKWENGQWVEIDLRDHLAFLGACGDRVRPLN